MLSRCVLNDGTHRLTSEFWLPLIPNDGKVDELRIPLTRKQRFAFFTFCRRHNQLHQSGIVDYGFCRQPRSIHFCNQLFQGRVVDVCQRNVSKVRVEPLIQAILPSAEGCRFQWLSLAASLLRGKSTNVWWLFDVIVWAIEANSISESTCWITVSFSNTLFSARSQQSETFTNEQWRI